MSRLDYITQWNTLFTNYVSTTLKIIAGRMSQPEIGNEWKERLGALKFLLEGKDVCEVTADLARGL